METRTLTPELVDDYERLFTHAFSDNPGWGGCWCALFDDPCPDEAWDASDPGFAARNRENRLRAVARGEVTGVLAYVDGEPVGWVNAMPRDRLGNLRRFAAAVEPGDPSIGSVMCFVVVPQRRGQGVATALLDAADPHLRALGCEVAEAYPRATAPPPGSDLPWTAAYYKGTSEMFERAGYLPHASGDGFTVMRKPLA